MAIKRLLIFTLLCFSVTAFAQDTLTGLVAAWQTTEGSGTTAADSSTSSNNLTVTGATWSGAISPLTNALTYGTTGKHSDSANYTNVNFDYNQAFSISTWVKTTSTTTEQAVVGRLDTASNYKGWELNLATGGNCTGTTGECAQFFLINSYPSNAIQVVAPAHLTSGTLYHVVVTYDGSHTAAGVKFYTNGVLQTGNTTIDNTLTTTTTNTKNVRLGLRTDGTSDTLSGSIGATYIYNRVLTQADVTGLYNAPYTLQVNVNAPTFSPVAGTYNSNQSVTLSDTTSGATIFYTTDGTTPAESGGSPTGTTQTYSTAISISATTTVQAIGYKAGVFDSSVASAAYTLQVATPTFSPAAGTYSSVQNVTPSSTTSGAVIHSTVDGTTPTCASPSSYPLVISGGTTTVKSIGCLTGYSNSSVASAAYTINVAALPTASPVAGSYFTQQYVELSDTTTGAKLCYTTDGSTPTESGNACSGATLTYNGVKEPTITNGTSVSGGSCANGHYFYQVTATSAAGESALSNEVDNYDSGTNFTHVLNWSVITNATGYKVYRGATSGSELLLATISSGATVTYSDGCAATPSGAAPTYNTSAIATGSSGTFTLKALATVSGSGDSAVQTFTYIIDPADQTGVSDNLVAYYSADIALLNNLAVQSYQHPLDMWETGGNWRAVGNIGDSTNVNILNFVTLNYLASVNGVVACIDPSGYPCFDSARANRMVMTANTSTSFSADQWSAMTPAYQGAFRTGYPGVIVRGATNSTALTGYYAWVNPTGGTAEVGEYLNGAKTAFCNASGLTFSNGSELRLRVVGSSLQALYGGSVIPGCANSYTNTDIAQGNPGIAVNGSEGHGYLWHGGNIGTGVVANMTPTTNWSYGTYADTYNSSWFPHVPWTDTSSATSDTHWVQVAATSGVTGASYAAGSIGYTSLVQYVAPFQSTGQYQIYQWAQDLFNPNLQNEFQPLMMEAWEPGYADGTCAANGTTAYCNDVVAIYPGVQPSNWGFAQSPTNCASGSGSTHKSEYNCTPFFHITAVSPTLSPDNDVLSVVGSTYTPQKSDYIFAEFLNDGTVAVACKGGGAATAFQTSHAYAGNALFVDANGNLQHVTTAGTSASSAPGSWGTTYTPSAHSGSTTTSGGMISEYYGNPCPTTTKWSWVIPPVSNSITQSFIGRPGFPAIWLGGPGTVVSVFPYVTNITLGSATSSFACTMDSNLCTGSAQPGPFLW